MPRAQAVLLIGLSGCGKGTQAGLLEQRRGFTHVESSKVIEERFAAQAGDPIIERERARKEAGDIVATELVSAWMLDAIRERAESGARIVFSGSPRTVFEAETQLPLLEELYGRENIHLFHLKVDRKVAEGRSLTRRVCKAHQHPFGPEHQGSTCPSDGSPLIVRPDDSTAQKVEHRHERFAEQTAPVLRVFAQRGYDVHEIPAGEAREDVYDRIVRILDQPF